MDTRRQQSIRIELRYHDTTLTLCRTQVKNSEVSPLAPTVSVWANAICPDNPLTILTQGEPP